MSLKEPLKSDVVRLALLMGLCATIGVYLILTTAVIATDGVFYVEQAKRLAQDPAGVCRRCPPGYPFLLWTSHRIASLFASEDSPALWADSARAVTLLCRVLALVPLYFLGKRLVGSGHSFWALLVLIVLPYPAFYGSDILREWPYVLFLGAGVLLLHWSLTTGRWWAFALVGLDAGLGYLIRPESAQLPVYALLGLAVVRNASCETRLAMRGSRRFAAAVLLIAGFAATVTPYVSASGSLLPHQLRPLGPNMPPVISAVGPKPATENPLEFEVRQGDLLELRIQASDPDDDELSFSLAQIPAGSRPVYGFGSIPAGRRFWTISEQEKDSLMTHHPERWECEGVAWYAYARADARAGLRPVYRFWSPARQQHFYTMSESEKDAIIAESTADLWVFEGAVLYAFGEADRPADAIAVYRFWDPQRGYSWATTPPAEPDIQKDAVAWYVHPAGPSPAGAKVEGNVFRWRPEAGQQGEYPMNIIATDGRLPCCQLVTVRVTGDGTTRHDQVDRLLPRTSAYAGLMLPAGAYLWNLNATILQSPTLGDLPRAVNAVVAAVGENLMVLAVLPWVLGLYRCLRGRTGSLEWVLIASVLIVNLGLMLGRQIWFASGSDRRYAVAVISLTIFVLPMGLDVLAQAISRVRIFRGRSQRFWFGLLIAGSVLLCMPKLLLTPLRSEKVGLRTAGEWLRQNTPSDSVVAEPDHRVSFYAQRCGLLYKRHPDSRKADYVVEIARGDPKQMLAGWTQVYSVPLSSRGDKTVIVYRTDRGKQQSGPDEGP
ncbi:MAG: glycosyltransferase family 39 protein [Phycisphaerae bacterium]|nr:glycosyltransferase family 39 protein [Phycisphaerae bacterium]